MNLVVDTSVIISVITNEEHKGQLIGISTGADLIAPASIHWEIGNAFSAMFKRNRIKLEQAITALEAYNQIPIRFYDVGLSNALEVAHRLNLYAYDAYVICCSQKFKCPLTSLDKGLTDAANQLNILTLEV